MLAAKATRLPLCPWSGIRTWSSARSALVNCDDAGVYYRDGLALFLAGVRAQVGTARRSRSSVRSPTPT